MDHLEVGEAEVAGSDHLRREVGEAEVAESDQTVADGQELDGRERRNRRARRRRLAADPKVDCCRMAVLGCSLKPQFRLATSCSR